MNATFVQNRCNSRKQEGNLWGKEQQTIESAYGSQYHQQTWNSQRRYVLVNAAFATVCILKDALIYYLLDGIKQIYLILDIISYTILIPVHRKNKQCAPFLVLKQFFFVHLREKVHTVIISQKGLCHPQQKLRSSVIKRRLQAIHQNRTSRE